MSQIYKNSRYWLTIDIENLDSTNFNILWTKEPKLNYDCLVDNWIETTNLLDVKSTCFMLGNFAKENPKIVKKLHSAGHEIASHGMQHDLVNKIPLNKWHSSLIESKETIEDITGNRVFGYRAASWSMPFEEEYYETLLKAGYKYSSSYFPFRTYMYGNKIDKKNPFRVATKLGDILEIPVPKFFIPFAGGFYFRILPVWLQRVMHHNLNKNGTKSIFYIHPYELMDKNLIKYFHDYADFNLDFLLAFYSTSLPKDKIMKVFRKI